MKKIRNWVLAIGLAVVAGGGFVTAISPQVASAKVPVNPEDCSVNFLTFPTWFRGLVKVDSGKCVIMSPDDTEVGGISNFIWHIVLNVIEIGLQLVAYIALGFIIFGGFQYLTSAGSADAAVKARKTLINAVVGLGISFAAIAVTNLVSGIIK